MRNGLSLHRNALACLSAWHLTGLQSLIPEIRCWGRGFWFPKQTMRWREARGCGCTERGWGNLQGEAFCLQGEQDE